jgi:hypothetical protein
MLALEIVVVARFASPVTLRSVVTVAFVAVRLVMNAVKALRSDA